MNDISFDPAQPESDQMPTPPLVMAQASEPKIGRFKASLIITKESWSLLKKDKEMMMFPILSLIVSVIIIAIAGAVGFFMMLNGNLKNIENLKEGNYGIQLLIAFIFYFVTVFVTIFFETGIITIVKGRLNNQDLTFSDGLKNSFRKSGKIAMWALVAATVGIILKAISERSGLLGKIVIWILGAAWSILTFFIAPILIVEELSIKDSLQKSAAIIKKVWGETVIVNVGVSLFFSLLILIGLIVFIAALFTMNVKIIIAAGILWVLWVIILAIISSTLNVIFRVVLYEYANSGVIPQGFSPDVIRLAFRENKKKKGIIGIGGI
jgi:hypothetical protein